MALANFLDKAALGASQILKDFNSSEFENILNANTIGIAINESIAKNVEGRACADLLVRIVARLYPNLSFINTEKGGSEYIEELKSIALEINPKIDFLSEDDCTVIVALSGLPKKFNKIATFFVGSTGWLAKFSTKRPIGFGNSNNPFGAAVAACFGAANTFRQVFKKQLPFGHIDNDFTLSVIDYVKNPITDLNPELNKVDIGKVHLVGIGAIGNSAIWALSHVPNIKGEVQLIDGEDVDLSNLQRYLLAMQADVEKPKVEVAKAYLKKYRKLKVYPNAVNWNDYMSEKGSWNIDTVAVGVDSGIDRIKVQASLPKSIINAWTQHENIGISRHFDFLNEPCLACLYLPKMKKLSYSEIVAKNLNVPEPIVRTYLAINKPFDEQLLQIICSANQVTPEPWLQYLGSSVGVFYSKAVCGGTFMKLVGKNGAQENMEVPAAFESALAGILLAAELVIKANGLRKEPIKTKSNINLLRPLSDHLLELEYKDKSGNCICADEHYSEAYRTKYSIK